MAATLPCAKATLYPGISQSIATAGTWFAGFEEIRLLAAFRKALLAAALIIQFVTERAPVMGKPIAK